MVQTDVTVGRFSNGKIKVEPTQVRASNGTAYPFLTVPIELAFAKIDDVPPYAYQREVCRFVVLGIQAILSIEPGSGRIADSIPVFEPLEFTNERNMSRNYAIEFPLDPQRVKYLEGSRRGNLDVSLRFQLLLADYEPVVIKNEQGSEQKNVIASYQRVPNQPEIRFEIPQSSWVSQILPALGLGEYFLIEIPKGKKTLPDAWQYLEKAEIAFRNWNSKDVFANCRELGTSLDQSMKNKFGSSHFTYAIRWDRAFSGFKNLASWDLHLEDLKKSPKYCPDTVQTNKSDAEHLLLRTKALLKYAEEILED